MVDLRLSALYSVRMMERMYTTAETVRERSERIPRSCVAGDTMKNEAAVRQSDPNV